MYYKICTVVWEDFVLRLFINRNSTYEKELERSLYLLELVL